LVEYGFDLGPAAPGPRAPEEFDEAVEPAGRDDALDQADPDRIEVVEQAVPTPGGATSPGGGVGYFLQREERADGFGGPRGRGRGRTAGLASFDRREPAARTIALSHIARASGRRRAAHGDHPHPSPLDQQFSQPGREVRPAWLSDH